MPAKKTQSMRTPSGAAVMRTQITEAVLKATKLELSEVGFGRLSMESVAQRAGVSKPALYRRWKSKRELIATVLKEIITTNTPEIDTGSLEGDILSYLQHTHAIFTDPVGGLIMSDIVAELDRFPELAEEWGLSAVDKRHAAATIILENAKQRGEISPDVDSQMAMDFFVSPLYWRLKITRKQVDEKYLEEAARWIFNLLKHAEH